MHKAFTCQSGLVSILPSGHGTSAAINTTIPTVASRLLALAPCLATLARLVIGLGTQGPTAGVGQCLSIYGFL